MISALALLSASAAIAKPVRIMSLNQCTDLMLLQLVPKSRIASVSDLAHEAAGLVRPGLDTGVPVNHGSAEEVLAEGPDLILAGPFSTAAAKRLAGQAGAPLLVVDDAESFADVARNLRQVGRAVGEPAKAEALVAGMQRTLASLAASRPAGPTPVAVWNGDGQTPGRGTLFDAILAAAGAEDIGAASSRFGLEQILAARPRALLQADPGAPSLRTEAALHPLIRRLYRGRRIAYADTLYTCGLPQSADAARALQGALAKLPPGAPAW